MVDTSGHRKKHTSDHPLEALHTNNVDVTLADAGSHSNVHEQLPDVAWTGGNLGRRPWEHKQDWLLLLLPCNMIFICLDHLHSELLEDGASVPSTMIGKQRLRSQEASLGHVERFHLKLILLVV